MNKKFDINLAKKFLEKQELEEKEERERIRKTVLSNVMENLKNLFSNNDVEIFLVGSITQPYMFYTHSDVDIVLKNFKGDRFDIWTQLEGMIKRNVEIILFENCHFQEHVLKEGLKVV